MSTYDEYVEREKRKCLNCHHTLINVNGVWIHRGYFDPQGNVVCHCGCEDPEPKEKDL